MNKEHEHFYLGGILTGASCVFLFTMAVLIMIKIFPENINLVLVLHGLVSLLCIFILIKIYLIDKFISPSRTNTKEVTK